MEEIQEEAKRRFPIGCKYQDRFGIKYVLRSDDITYRISGNSIYAHGSGGCLYGDGIWSTNLDAPKEINYEVY